MTAEACTFLPPLIVERTGWALVHFVWQGAAVALLVALVTPLLRRQSANVRYLVYCAGMAAMAACPVITLLSMASLPTVKMPGSPVSAASGRAIPVQSFGQTVPMTRTIEPSVNAGIASEPHAGTFFKAASQSGAEPWQAKLRGTLEAHLAWIVVGWLVGVLAVSLHLLLGWAKVQRLKRSGTQQQCAHWQEVVERLSRQLRVSRPVRLLESGLASAPIAIGWLRPMILLPASTLTGLTPRQLEAILAHELAHIRRHDYLVNLLQTVVETILFYHPAVHWVSHRVRIERERCCDDLAVAVCGDSLTYARALTELEGLRGVPGGVAVAAAGNSLPDRIRRIVGLGEQREVVSWRSRAGAMAMAAVAAMGLSLGIWDLGARAEGNSRIAAAALHVPTAPAQETQRLIAQLSADDPWLREVAVKGLADRGDKRAAEGLITALNDKERIIRIRAAEALGKLRCTDGVRALAAAMENDSSEDVRRTAAEALGAIGDPKAVEPLIVALNDADGSVRGAVAAALSSIGDRRAVEPLIARTKVEGNSDLLAQFAMALGRLGDTRAVEPLIEVLGRGNEWVRQLTVSALGTLGGTRAAETLIAELKDPDSTVRSEAARSLGKIGDERSVEPLIAALKDAGGGTDKSAAWALGQIGDARAIEPLTQAAMAKPGPVMADALDDLRLRTSEGLGRVNATDIDVLRGTLRDSDAGLRRAAIRALAGIGGPDAAEAVAHATADEDAGARFEAGKALASVHDPRAIPPLAGALRDSNSSVRSEAARLLGEIRDSRAAEPLVTALKDPDIVVWNEPFTTLATVADAGTVDTLIGTLKDQRRAVASRAARVLGEIGGSQATEGLIGVLGDPASTIHREATCALGGISSDRATQGLIYALADLSAAPGDEFGPGVRGAAAEELGKRAWRPETHSQEVRYLVAAERWDAAAKVAPSAEVTVPGGNVAEGRLELDVPILVNLKEAGARTLWMEFQRVDDKLYGVLSSTYRSWPADEWRATVALKDPQGGILKQAEASFDNKPAVMIDLVYHCGAGLRFDLGAWADVAKAARFSLFLTHYPGVPEVHEAEPEASLQMPDSRSECRAVALDGKVYLIGGYTGDWSNGHGKDYSGDCFVCDSASGKWTRIGSLNVGRHSHNTLPINGKIWCVGGVSEAQAQVEMYDPSADKWQVMTNDPSPRGEFACAAVGDRIYMFAGTSGDPVTIYDTKTNSWHKGAPLRTPRFRCSAAAVDGKIFLVGGSTKHPVGMKTVEMYDPEKDEWKACAELPRPLCDGTAVAHNGRVYVFGGMDNLRLLREILEYDPAKDTWRIAGRMARERTDVGAAFLGNTAYVFGGGWGYNLNDFEIIRFSETQGSAEAHDLNGGEGMRTKEKAAKENITNPVTRTSLPCVAFLSTMSGQPWPGAIEGPPSLEGYSRDLFVANYDGQDLVNISDNPESWPCNPAWSPDGKYLSWVSKRGLELFSNGQKKVVIPSSDYEIGAYAWSPTSTQLAFVGCKREGGRRVEREAFYLTGITDPSPRKLLDLKESDIPYGPGHLVWLRGASALLWCANNGNIEKMAISAAGLTGPPETVFTPERGHLSSGISVAKDGATIATGVNGYFPDGVGSLIWTFTPDGRDARRLTQTTDLRENRVAWCPADENLLAFSAGETAPPHGRFIALYRVDTRELRRFELDDAYAVAVAVAWSGDGRYVVAECGRKRGPRLNSNIVVLDIATSTWTRITNSPDTRDFNPVCRP